jgi:hypothetical protein
MWMGWVRTSRFPHPRRRHSCRLRPSAATFSEGLALVHFLSGCEHFRGYAVLEGGSNGDGAWLGPVTIVELMDPRPHTFQSAVYGTSMSDPLLTQADPNPRLSTPSNVRRG